MSDHINNHKINELLENSKNYNNNDFESIIKKSKNAKGLTLEEVSILLQVSSKSELSQLYNAAKFVKQKVYGKRVVLFAPLYTSNECTNNCLYCGFRRDNKKLHRKTLSMEEIVQEAKEIEKQGHKRLLLICGEDPKKTNVDHIIEAMKEIYYKTGIRRINVETAPMSVEDYKKLKEADVGTYVIFQETYDREVYKKMHPYGTKSNYDFRLEAIDRAFEAGIDDVGVGVLLGLNDYKFEVLALLMHCEAFEKKFGVGPHTISVPRLRPAVGWALDEIPNEVSDEDFRKIVAVFRLAVPYTGIILSTRENKELREELLSLGVSQISAGSKTNPGGYAEKDEQAEQFTTYDGRTLDKIVEMICDKGYIPSFCTACYRRCRTGEEFMKYAKESEISQFCQPNAILTFKENLIDYGDKSLRVKGKKVIEQALEEIIDEEIRKSTKEKLIEIEKGKRDIYF